jgi:hypothetical protein
LLLEELLRPMVLFTFPGMDMKEMAALVERSIFTSANPQMAVPHGQPKYWMFPRLHRIARLFHVAGHISALK